MRLVEWPAEGMRAIALRVAGVPRPLHRAGTSRRSSAVLAILERLPEVTVVQHRPLLLGLTK